MKLSVLKLSCKSFAVNDCLMSGTQRLPDFTAAVFCSCLFLGYFDFMFAFSKWNECSVGLRSGDRFGNCRTLSVFALKKSLVDYTVSLRLLSICTVKDRPMSFETFVSCHIINKYKGTMSFGSHTCLQHNTTSTVLHRWGGIFWIMSNTFPFLDSSLAIIFFFKKF